VLFILPCVFPQSVPTAVGGIWIFPHSDFHLSLPILYGGRLVDCFSFVARVLWPLVLVPGVCAAVLSFLASAVAQWPSPIPTSSFVDSSASFSAPVCFAHPTAAIFRSTVRINHFPAQSCRQVLDPTRSFCFSFYARKQSSPHLQCSRSRFWLRSKALAQ
jgi:hypothetical protein